MIPVGTIAFTSTVKVVDFPPYDAVTVFCPAVAELKPVHSIPEETVSVLPLLYVAVSVRPD